MQRLEALIFDLEGTLVDSTIDIAVSLNTILTEEGRQPLTQEQMASCLVEGIMDSCKNAFEATGGIADDELYPMVKRLVEHMRTAPASEEQLYPHVRDVLDRYKDAGLKMGICTNKNEEATKKQLAELGLLDHFGFVAGGNTFMVHKPNPEHVIGVMEKLGVTAHGTLFVGDGMGDLLACKGANVPCIIITHSETSEPLDKDATVSIKEFDELDDCFQKLGYKY